jgi:DNA-binding transcriptional ArsR family regulator
MTRGHRDAPIERVILDWFGTDGCNIDSPSRIVLLVIARHTGPDDEMCFPGIQRIAEMTGVSKSTVRRKIRKLEGVGLIQVQSRFGSQGNLSNIYRINHSRIKHELTDSRREKSVRSGSYPRSFEESMISRGPANGVHGDNSGCQGGGEVVSQSQGEGYHRDPLTAPDERHLGTSSVHQLIFEVDANECAAGNSQFDKAPGSNKSKPRDAKGIRDWCQAHGFENWWELYGHKIARAEAESGFMKLEDSDRFALEERTRAYLSRRAQAKGQGDWIPDLPHGSDLPAGSPKGIPTTRKIWTMRFMSLWLERKGDHQE